MYSFRNDYSEGAHPRVLQALLQSNADQSCGYGLDPFCLDAARQIRVLCEAPEAAVHFLVGGTQTNLVTIDALLRPCEAVIAAHTGHVNVHETGAIEATGHKVCAVPSCDGKVTCEMVESVVAAHSSEHMVIPRLVYISDTTETGTVYTRDELSALRRCCNAHDLLLYLDGARLGSALTVPGADVTLPDLAALTDAFTIGGTKNGALFGEAVILTVPCSRFRWHMKQRGAVLAKGRMLGLQFQALLENGLYFDLARHANEMARRLRQGLEALGCPTAWDSPSNQQFVVLSDPVITALQDAGYEFEIDHPEPPDHTCIRLVTSWATPPQAVDAFLQDLAARLPTP